MRPADLAIILRVHFWQLSQAQMLLSQHCMLNSHAHGVLQDDSNVIMQSICYCHILFDVYPKASTPEQCKLTWPESAVMQMNYATVFVTRVGLQV